MVKLSYLGEEISETLESQDEHHQNQKNRGEHLVKK